MKKILKKILRLLGLQVSLLKQKKLGYDLEEDACKVISIVRKNTMLPYERLVTLYQQATYCEKVQIQGSFVECGVWKGGAVGLMAYVNLDKSNTRRDIHLFDVFDDIGEPDPAKDGQQGINEVERLLGRKTMLNGQLKPLKGIYDRFGGFGSLNENKMLLEKTIGYPEKYLHYHVGWFQDIMPKDSMKIDQIAILRLDGDWYDSIKVCLEYLYPKVVKGGFLIIDDYGHLEGCTKAVNEYFQKQYIHPYLHHINYGARYIVK